MLLSKCDEGKPVCSNCIRRRLESECEYDAVATHLKCTSPVGTGSCTPSIAPSSLSATSMPHSHHGRKPGVYCSTSSKPYPSKTPLGQDGERFAPSLQIVHCRRDLQVLCLPILLPYSSCTISSPQHVSRVSRIRICSTSGRNPSAPSLYLRNTLTSSMPSSPFQHCILLHKKTKSTLNATIGIFWRIHIMLPLWGCSEVPWRSVSRNRRLVRKHQRRDSKP